MGSKHMELQSFVIFIAFFFYRSESYMVENITFDGYHKWTPTTSRRDDLFCPDNCNAVLKSAECCACNALPCWKIDAEVCGVQVEELYIEYTDPFGSASLVANDMQNTTLFILKHINGRLRKLPDNICSFADSLVEIDLSNNHIMDITEIKCLKMLDTLRLDHNKITQIPDGTFSEMETLRYLSMANNDFLDLQPFATKLKQGNILTVDFSYNAFRKVDVTNILRPGEFCEVNFIGSEIEYQTNEANYVLEKNIIHGPGKIDFTNSKGKTWLNFTSLGVRHYSEFGKYLDSFLYWDNSSVHCDCNIVPFLRDLGDQASHYWPTLDFDFVCETPAHMKGENLTKLYHNGDYDNLTCDLEICPSGCSCTDKQNQNKVVVNCNGLDKFPEFMPLGYWGNNNIELDLNGNSIKDLPNRDFLSRLSVLKLKGNALKRIDPDAVKELKDVTIDMSDHEVERIPETFYNLDPDYIDFGNNPVICDCDNLWIGEWILTHATQPSLHCKTIRGVVIATMVTADFLNCPEPTTPLPAVIWILTASILVLVAATIVLYCFRYELILLKRRATFKRNEKVLNTNEYDIFLSFSEKNDEVFQWVYNFLLPFLSRYSCFVPFRDVYYGDVRDKVTGTAIKDSRNFIVVLCREYLADEKSLFEFETIWKYFSMDTKKQIVVINYDHFESSEIADNRLRAFVRINYDLNFEDRETKFLERLKKRLGRTVKQTRYSSNPFRLEPVTSEELSLPEIDRGQKGRRSMRYRMNTGIKKLAQCQEACTSPSPEILPNTPIDRVKCSPDIRSSVKTRDITVTEVI